MREQSRYSEPVALDDAISEMDALNHRFLFFTDRATRRGAVLYLRYDGHYGLIEPASSIPGEPGDHTAVMSRPGSVLPRPGE